MYFFFNDTATTEIYTLSLHDALPIFSFFDPGVLGNVGFNANGPDYRIRGVETSVIGVLAHGLTAQGRASLNSREQTNSPFLLANNLALLAIPAIAGQYGKPRLHILNP